MRRLLPLLVLLAWLAPLNAQTNSRIRQLQDRQGQLKKQIEETQTLLNAAKKDVGSQLNALNALTAQIEERRKYIDTLTNDVAQIDREIAQAEARLATLQDNLSEKQDNYAQSLRYFQRHGSIHRQLLFIFSAENLAQSLRRLRYVRQYAAYQRQEGEALKQQQAAVRQKREELAEARTMKTDVLQLREAERRQLQGQERAQRTLLGQLRNKQRSLQDEIKKQRAEANKLNAQIDRLVAAEIEKARKQAEEEARREAAARAATPRNNTTTAPRTTYTAAKTDQALSASFEQNRGKLPVPISTPYIIVSHFGQYNVAGMKNVTLDNKGIDIQGRPGAKARAVFNGTVAAVFQLNGLFNILVRHGQYISVYCHLASANVKQGDEVSTKQELGQVFTDTANDNRTVLHFQLRKERDKLNPERWVNF